MSPLHFFGVYQAETDRLFRRATAVAGLVLSALFGLGGPLLLFLVNTFVIGPGEAQFQADRASLYPDGEVPVLQDSPYMTWVQAVYLTYYVRNFMFLPILIFLLGGLSMASEFVARTTREDVLRPVPRWALLGGKWLALATWILAATALTGGLSALAGLALCGGLEAEPGMWGAIEDATGWAWLSGAVAAAWSAVALPMQQIGFTLVTDLGFATLALGLAVLTRSVAATVASLVMIFVIQAGVSFGFIVVNNDIVRQLLAQQAPWMEEPTREAIFAWVDFLSKWQPPFVIGVCPLTEITWQSFVTLGVITLGSLALGLVRFETMDVP